MPAAPVIRYTGEHHIGSVLIWELVLYRADWPDSRLLGRLRWGRPSRRLQQQEVNAVASSTPEFMHWSERPISWSRVDHPEVMPSPGSYALVLDATFATERQAARFSRVLIDGSSSINILYKDTMEKLGISVTPSMRL